MDIMAKIDLSRCLRPTKQTKGEGRMYGELFNSFIQRELDRLKEELMQFPDEASLWVKRDGVSNTAGNLALHIAGNLNHFIGAVLGGTGYVRDRELEFSAKDVPRSELIGSIENTKHVVAAALAEITDEDLKSDYPLEKSFGKVSTSYLLIHLITHLNYHLGQINYYRRLGAGGII